MNTPNTSSREGLATNESLVIDINGCCNEQCKFCYQNLDGSVLSEDEIAQIVDGSSAQTVNLGGGEPFIDSRIVNIIRSVRAKGRRGHISTNATEIPRGLLDLDKRVRDGIEIQVSIHAANPKLYWGITGTNRLDRVVGNARTLKNHFATVMTAAIYQENFHDVENIVALSEELGLPLRVNLVFPVGKGKDVELLTPQQVEQLRGYLLQKRVFRGNAIESPLVHQANNCYAISEHYGAVREGICPFDCGKVYVSPRGERSGCEFYKPVQLTVKGKSIDGGEKK